MEADEKRDWEEINSTGLGLDERIKSASISKVTHLGNNIYFKLLPIFRPNCGRNRKGARRWMESHLYRIVLPRWSKTFIPSLRQKCFVKYWLNKFPQLFKPVYDISRATWLAERRGPAPRGTWRQGGVDRSDGFTVVFLFAFSHSIIFVPFKEGGSVQVRCKHCCFITRFQLFFSITAKIDAEIVTEPQVTRKLNNYSWHVTQNTKEPAK